jgi:2-oxo-4-hydroxy-4-carboxy-5-ureidoimidazoline decarboxylase
MNTAAVFPLSLEAVNAMDEAAFVAAFGDIAEHAPWVATEAAASRPFATREAMVDAFAAAIADADPDRQRALLLGHPDLAGRAAIAGDMTADSRREQTGAGLDALTPEEFARFTEMNAAYRQRHGIPFILAVRRATRADILAAYENRLGNRPEAEFGHAVEQVQRIVQFRIEDRVRD